MKSEKAAKTPWPTKDAMRQIYEKHMWGGKETEFYSGEGSHLSEIVNPYLEAVKSFLSSFETPLSVCDLGCGDFNVGKEIVPYTEKYVAIDIVPELVAFNQENYKAENLEFHCLDLAVDELPVTDCAILRQVLQHLSNDEVQSILNKLQHFKYLILSEHLPSGEFTPNKDIISGQGIRLRKQSGLILTQAPFNLQCKLEREMASYLLKDGKSKIVTTLFELK